MLSKILFSYHFGDVTGTLKRTNCVSTFLRLASLNAFQSLVYSLPYSKALFYPSCFGLWVWGTHWEVGEVKRTPFSLS